jgi:hypothetical protein
MVDPTTISYQIPAGDGFSVVAYDFANNVTIADQTFSDVTITTPSVPHGVVDQAYSTTITTSGGTGLYYYTSAAGVLPDGLTLSSSGTISGTPVIAGSYTFTVQVTDGNSVDTKEYTMNVNSSGLAITTTSPLPRGTIGVPYYQVLSAVGGDGTDYSWSLNSGTLPPGLSLDLLTPSVTSTTAALQGTPTTAGTFSFTLKVVSGGQTAFKHFSVIIEPVGPYALTTTASPSTGGSIARSPDAASYAPGTVVTLTASPAAGWHLVSWSGATPDGVDPLKATVTMDADKTVTATFALTPSDSIGVYRSSNIAFYLRSSDGTVSSPIYLGDSGDLPIIGDWNDDGTDEIGVFRPSTASFYFRSSDGTVPSPIYLGDLGDTAIIGIWPQL